MGNQDSYNITSIRLPIDVIKHIRQNIGIESLSSWVGETYRLEFMNSQYLNNRKEKLNEDIIKFEKDIVNKRNEFKEKLEELDRKICEQKEFSQYIGQGLKLSIEDKKLINDLKRSRKDGTIITKEAYKVFCKQRKANFNKATFNRLMDEIDDFAVNNEVNKDAQ
jgi:hypothetical protein